MMIMKPVDNSFRTGIEFDGKYEITDDLTTSNFSTFSYNKILTNGFDHMLFSPSVILNQDLNYTYKDFFVNLSARYLSKQHIDLNDKNSVCPSYATLNGAIGFDNKFLNLTLSVINITNTNYYTAGNVSNDGTKNYFVGTPLSFYTTLRIKL